MISRVADPWSVVCDRSAGGCRRRQRSRSDHQWSFGDLWIALLRTIGMGTTFAKLSYPFATYGILSVVDALTAVPAARRDQRLAAMVDAIEAARADDDYRAATVSAAWANFDFGQKKLPSPWITALVARAVRRMGN